MDNEVTITTTAQDLSTQGYGYGRLFSAAPTNSGTLYVKFIVLSVVTGTPTTYKFSGQLLTSDPFAQGPCFSGNSLVTTKDGIKKALEVKEGGLLLSDKNEWIPLISNVICGTTSTYYVIKKNFHGATEDLYLTQDHPVKINNEEIKAQEIGEQYNCEREPIYTFVTEERIFVMINNIPVCTWSQKDWDDFKKSVNVSTIYK